MSWNNKKIKVLREKRLNAEKTLICDKFQGISENFSQKVVIKCLKMQISRVSEEFLNLQFQWNFTIQNLNSRTYTELLKNHSNKILSYKSHTPKVNKNAKQFQKHFSDFVEKIQLKFHKCLTIA